MSPDEQITRGVERARKILGLEYHLMRRHLDDAKKVGQHQFEPGIRLHLGCGRNRKEGWVNVDLFSSDADFRLDLREPWPFRDNVASIVYSEHFFEHLLHPVDTSHYLAEAFRVLADDGILTIGVPDTEWPVLAYADRADSYWQLSAERWHPPSCRTRMEHLNYHFRQDGEHKYAWDRETLSMFVASAGFSNVRERGFSTELDSEDRRLGTIYLEAERPRGAPAAPD